jgi:hypothetical protein
MFRLDLSAPDAPRVLYTSEDYVPAFRAVSDAGLTADRWWIDTGETHEERSLHTAALRPWSAEQRAALREARALAEQFARQHRRPPSLDREDDLAWFDEAWWKAHPDQNPLLDLEAERLHKLARCVYLAPPGSSLPDGQRGDLTPPGPPLPQGQRGEERPKEPEPERKPAAAARVRSRGGKKETATGQAAEIKAEPPPPLPLRERGAGGGEVPELRAARSRLLTVLRLGSLGVGGRLLLDLRGRSGVNAIYSASARSFVPLGYWG